MDDKDNLIQDDSENEEDLDVEPQAARVRQLFIRVAYGLRMIYVLTAAGFLVFFAFEDSLRAWVRDHVGLIFFGTIFALHLFLVVVRIWCIGRVQRFKWKSPSILIFLSFLIYLGFTIAEGFLVALTFCIYERNELFLGAGIAVISYLSLSIFTLQTKFDFLGKGPYFLVAVLVLIIFGITAVFLTCIIPMPNLIFTCVIALLLSYLQIYDVQSLLKSSLVKGNGYMIMLKNNEA